MPPSLDPSFCRVRQDRLRGLLREHELDAAVLTNRHYVHALTGYWHQQPLTPVAVLIRTEGSTTIVSPDGSRPTPAVDDRVHYVSSNRATLVENLEGNMLAVLMPLLHDVKSIGSEARLLPKVASKAVDITVPYQYLRRKKDSDEVALLHFAIRATETAYGELRSLLRSGPTEIELYAAAHAAALRVVGEPLSGWGNDFQSGSPGGLPRPRSVGQGELAIYDLGVGVRGYRSDLCRTFVVGGDPTDLQVAAHRRILEAFQHIERELKPGLSCSALFNEIHEMLDGWEGYSFTHHLGHGIGLDAHEVPRLNPHWDDRFEPGDVVAVEPALYGDPLRAGIRLEQDYLITETGFERLSSFPMDL